MDNKSSVYKFFLGANSPTGFFSKFEESYDPEKGWFRYVLKGGPGTGKSGLMKKVAAYASNKGLNVEKIYCSSDPDSLDAVILQDLKTCVVDGTAPHVIDPKYPGAADTVINLCDYWDEDLLFKNRKEITTLTRKNLLLHMRASGYLKSFGIVRNDTLNIINRSLNVDKITAYAERLSKKLFKRGGKTKGYEKVRLISAITPRGVIFFEDTITEASDVTYVIEDKYGAVSDLILRSLRDRAIDDGVDLISCFCPTAPDSRLEGLIFPDLRISFVTSNDWHHINNLREIGKKINAKRFLDKNSLSAHSKLASFNRKIEKELLTEAITSLEKAKSVHDELEKYYVRSMDFQAIDSLAEETIGRIFK